MFDLSRRRRRFFVKTPLRKPLVFICLPLDASWRTNLSNVVGQWGRVRQTNGFGYVKE